MTNLELIPSLPLVGDTTPILSTVRRPSRDLELCVEESPWKSFVADSEEAKHVLGKFNIEVVELAFRHGGYVAGGFGRCMKNGTLNPFMRAAMVANKADIDLFFRTQKDLNNYIADVEQRYQEAAKFEISKMNYAFNFNHKLVQGMRMGNTPFPIQAIGCCFGEPEHIIRGFDIHNCMVAFDAEKMWSTKTFDIYEREGVLGVSNWSSSSTYKRITKYMARHGFVDITDDLTDGERMDQMHTSFFDAYDYVSRSKKLPNDSDQRILSMIYDSTVHFVHANQFLTMSEKANKIAKDVLISRLATCQNEQQYGYFAERLSQNGPYNPQPRNLDKTVYDLMIKNAKERESILKGVLQEGSYYWTVV